MAENGDLSVRFWGVRGSIACGGPETAGYGGNTSCLEIRCDSRPLILDAGTGMRPLGEYLLAESTAPVDVDVLLTHTHFDHICGLPFFRPVYKAGHTIRIHAGHLLPKHTVQEVMCGMMMAPLFPVRVDMLAADLTFHDFRTGEALQLKCGARAVTKALNHPNNASGYRIEYGGKAICYVTDTEHFDGRLDENVLTLIEGADYFIYDAMFTADEYDHCRGWGHSTWQAGADLADAAGVKTYVIFHHDPSHDDAFMDRIAAAAERRRPGTVVAREGLTLSA